MAKQQDLAALELSRAGVSVPAIQEQIGFKTARACESAIARARKAQGLVIDAAAVREMELDRLNRLQAAVWAKAARGDVNAIDRVIKLGEARVRLAGVPATSAMLESFEATLAALEVRDVDASVIEAGRRIAMSIDAAAGTGDRVAETKALYLIPHLMNVLRELGATPAAREELSAAAAAVPGGGTGQNELEAFKNKKRGRPA